MKFASIILLCLVTLSVIYGLSVVWLNYRDANSISSIEGIDLLKSLGNASYYPAGDPIDSPRPRSQTT